MAAIDTTGNGVGRWGLLARERIIAKPGFNRWLVPPAALAIHLCIGMAYGFSVFWLPLSRSIGITKFVACPDQTLVSALYTTNCDWCSPQLSGSTSQSSIPSTASPTRSTASANGCVLRSRRPACQSTANHTVCVRQQGGG